MVRIRVLRLAILVALLAITIYASLPFTVEPAMAQPNTGAVEIAYDDGIPWKKVTDAMAVCGSCVAYEGVRFGLGGVEVAALTSVRFYASVGQSTTMWVYINDIKQNPLAERIRVSVSRNGWYVVPMPEVSLAGDFFVWIYSEHDSTLPFLDAGNDAYRSFITERPGATQLIPVKGGDFMIRASVRAEIHVGKEDRYKYHVIQEAVNAADPFITIVVHPGTYIENVTVPKNLSIISSDGPSATVVAAATPAADVFSIASDAVAIDGFTIRGGSGDQVAGVRLNAVASCSVSNNTILDNYYGIYLAEPSGAGVSRENEILQNVVTSNTYAIWVGGQRNNICGNRIEDNTATRGSGVYLSEASVDNWLRFNSFNPSPSSDHAVEVFYDGMFKPVDAIQNWWGAPSGPHHPADNPDGTGAGVGDTIELTPWLSAAPLRVATGTADVSQYVLDARAEASTTVELAGSGRPIVWVASYSGNPGGEFPTPSIGKWMDVCLSSTGGLDEVEITAYYTLTELGDLKEGDLRLYWWNGSEWVPCSKQKLYKAEDCIRATIAPDSSPGLSNLAGTPFALGASLDSGGFQWLWLLVVPLAIIGLFVVVILGRIVVRAISSRGTYYDYE